MWSLHFQNKLMHGGIQLNMKKLLTFFFLLLTISSCTTNATAQVSTNPAPTPSINIIIPTPPSCTDIVAEPTPGPDVPSVFPPVTEKDYVRGAQNPVVTLMDYSDYQDPRSALFADVVNELLAENPNDVKVVSRIFPLIVVNDKAAIAAQAAEAAAEQDKFWEVHDLLYEQQANWLNLSVEDFESWLTAQVSALGMNVEQFQSDLKREDIVARVQQAWNDGQKMGLPGTPLVLINGQIYGGPRDFNSLNNILKLIQLGERQFETCPLVTVQEDKQYIATLHTEKGDVVMQLFPNKAPITVNSFIFLARNGWYDDITFHRVLPELYAQTGDPSGTGKGNPGYYVITEIDPTLKFDRPGVVAMVNSGPDTSGSQFFITYAAAPDFDGKYTIFGQVLSGMEILQQLSPRDPKPDEFAAPGDKLLSITIEEK
jgi:cyclophilin family peptidyl-prolyl cis-trans isomerase/protein-disulfide isomerase